MKKMSVMFILAAVVWLVPSCATAPVTNGGKPGVKAVSLVIESPVRARTPYPAMMVCTLPVAGIDQIKGYFFWNGEGPFEYPLTSGSVATDPRLGRCAVLMFNLYTGRPATYTITGYITFRDATTGEQGRTDIVSAGAIRVQ